MGSKKPTPPYRADVSDRAACAADLFERPDLFGRQQRWYSRRAGRNKQWVQILGFVIVFGGAATAVVQLWVPDPPDTPIHWTTVFTAMLGALVVLAKGIERIWDFDGTWKAYRQASEAMKHERRNYLVGSGAYRGLDDQQAHLAFVERLEQVIAAEQGAYWGARGEEEGKSTGE